MKPSSAKQMPENFLEAYWWRRRRNFGDALNPVLLHAISGLPVRWSCAAGHDVLAACGSLLALAKPGWRVWGSGVLNPEFAIPSKLDILAVRGPRTWEHLRRLRHFVPEVFGDPGLLMPIVRPLEDGPLEYDWAIIPHYKDRFHRALWEISLDSLFAGSASKLNRRKVLVINPAWSIDRYLQALGRCRAVIASSLHGVVMGEAYRKPTVWIKLGIKLAGGDFKFHDFYESIGRSGKPVVVADRLDWCAIESAASDPRTLNWNPRPLMASFPYKTEQWHKYSAAASAYFDSAPTAPTQHRRTLSVSG